MTRYLLDTSILSDVVKPRPSASLLQWWAAQRDEDLFIASLSLAEIRRAILERPRGKARDALDAWFSGPEGPAALFSGRVLPFDARAALIWARLMAERSPRSALDMVVAAVAEANGCTLATDNALDFAGLPFVNPLRAA